MSFCLMPCCCIIAGKGLLHKWQPRFWVLYSSGDLVYYTDEFTMSADGKCATVAQLQQSSIGLLHGRADCKDGHFPSMVPDVCCLGFVTSSRTYYAYSASLEEAKQWKACIGGFVVPTQPSTPSRSASHESSLGPSPLSATPSPNTRATGKGGGASRIRNVNLGRRASFFSRDRPPKEVQPKKAAEAPGVLQTMPATRVEEERAEQVTAEAIMPATEAVNSCVEVGTAGAAGSSMSASSSMSADEHSTVPLSNKALGPAPGTAGGAMQNQALMESGACQGAVKTHEVLPGPLDASAEVPPNTSASRAPADVPHAGAQSHPITASTANSAGVVLLPPPGQAAHSRRKRQSMVQAQPLPLPVYARENNNQHSGSAEMPQEKHQTDISRTPDEISIPVMAAPSNDTREQSLQIQAELATAGDSSRDVPIKVSISYPEQPSRTAGSDVCVPTTDKATAQSSSTMESGTEHAKVISEYPGETAKTTSTPTTTTTGNSAVEGHTAAPQTIVAPALLPPPPGQGQAIQGRRKRQSMGQLQTVPMPGDSQMGVTKSESDPVVQRESNTQSTHYQQGATICEPSHQPSFESGPRAMSVSGGTGMVEKTDKDMEYGSEHSVEVSKETACTTTGSSPLGSQQTVTAEVSLTANHGHHVTPEQEPRVGKMMTRQEESPTPQEETNVEAHATATSLSPTANFTTSNDQQHETATGGQSAEPDTQAPVPAEKLGIDDMIAELQNLGASIGAEPATTPDKNLDLTSTSSDKALDLAPKEDNSEEAISSLPDMSQQVALSVEIPQDALKPVPEEPHHTVPVNGEGEARPSSGSMPTFLGSVLDYNDDTVQPTDMQFETKLERERWELQLAEERQARFRRTSSAQLREHEAARLLAQDQQRREQERRERERLQEEKERQLKLAQEEMKGLAARKEKEEENIRLRMIKIEEDRKRAAEEEEQRLRKTSGSERRLSVRKRSSAEPKGYAVKTDEQSNAAVLQKAATSSASISEGHDKMEAERREAEEMERKISERRATISKERDQQRLAARRKKEAALAAQQEQALKEQAERESLEQEQRRQAAERSAAEAARQREEQERITRERQEQLEAERIQAAEHESQVLKVRSNLFLEQDKARKKREAAERQREAEEAQKKLEQAERERREQEERKAEDLKRINCRPKLSKDPSIDTVEERQKQLDKERAAFAEAERQRAEKAKEMRVKHNQEEMRKREEAERLRQAEEQRKLEEAELERLRQEEQKAEELRRINNRRKLSRDPSIDAIEERQKQLEKERLVAAEAERQRAEKAKEMREKHNQEEVRKREAAERQRQAEEQQKLEEAELERLRQEKQKAEELRRLNNRRKLSRDPSIDAIEERQRQLDKERLVSAEAERHRAEKAKEMNEQYGREEARRRQEKYEMEQAALEAEKERKLKEQAEAEERWKADARKAREAHLRTIAANENMLMEHRRAMEEERLKIEEYDKLISLQRLTPNTEELKQLERDRAALEESIRARKERELREVERQREEEAFRAEEAKRAAEKEKERVYRQEEELASTALKLAHERRETEGFEERLMKLRDALGPHKSSHDREQAVEDLDVLARKEWESRNSPMIVARRHSLRPSDMKPSKIRKFAIQDDGYLTVHPEASTKPSSVTSISTGTSPVTTADKDLKQNSQPAAIDVKHPAEEPIKLVEPLRSGDDIEPSADSSPSVQVARLMWQTKTGQSPQASPKVRRASDSRVPQVTVTNIRSSSPISSPLLGRSFEPLTSKVSTSIPSPLSRSRATSTSSTTQPSGMTSPSSADADSEVERINRQSPAASSGLTSSVVSPTSGDEVFSPSETISLKNRIAAIQHTTRVRRNSLPNTEAPHIIQPPRPSTPVLARVSHLASDSEGELSGGEEDPSVRRQRQATKWVEKELVKVT